MRGGGEARALLVVSLTHFKHVARTTHTTAERKKEAAYPALHAECLTARRLHRVGGDARHAAVRAKLLREEAGAPAEAAADVEEPERFRRGRGVDIILDTYAFCNMKLIDKI